MATDFDTSQELCHWCRVNVSLPLEIEIVAATTIVSHDNVPVAPGRASIVTRSGGQKPGQWPQDKCLIFCIPWFWQLQKRDEDFFFSSHHTCDKESRMLDKTKALYCFMTIG